jgi:hypothetical protein
MNVITDLKVATDRYHYCPMCHKILLPEDGYIVATGSESNPYRHQNCPPDTYAKSPIDYSFSNGGIIHRLSEHRSPERRDVSTESTRTPVGSTGAVSSSLSPDFRLISPRLLRRLAERKSGGTAKYGPTQSRIGLGDPDYIADRLNHFLDHLNKWLADGNEKDDNLGAMVWGLDFLFEAEHFFPELLEEARNACNLHGEYAREYNQQVIDRRPKTIDQARKDLDLS